MELVFEWDARKDRENLEKHRITFAEATSVFGGRRARIFADEDHSVNEQREIIIGHSQMKRLLLVCSPSRSRAGSASSALGAQPGENSTTMKSTSHPKAKQSRSDGLRPEY